MTISHNGGRAVGADFSLPWKEARTLAQVWTEQKVRKATERKERAVRTYFDPPLVTPRGKIAFAGYDQSETQFRSRR